MMCSCAAVPLLQAVQSFLKLYVGGLESAYSQREPGLCGFGKRVKKARKLRGVVLVVVQHVGKKRLGLFKIGGSFGGSAVNVIMVVSVAVIVVMGVGVSAAVVGVGMTFTCTVGMAGLGVIVDVLVSMGGAVSVGVLVAVGMGHFVVDMHGLPPFLSGRAQSRPFLFIFYHS